MVISLKASFISAWLLTLISFSAYSQKITSVKGHVIDAKTKETMPYVNVQFDGTTIGVTSDIDGHFYLETKTPVSKLKISYVGYTTQTLKIKQGEANELTIKMEESAVDLKEVVVTQGKYRNRDNPAVELIKKVIENKSKNRKEGFSYYSFNKHEKAELSLNNISDKMKNNILFRKIKFVFDNVDTNKATGKVNWPFFFRENISDIYYRKDPKAKKEYIRAEKVTNFEELLNTASIHQALSNLTQEINFYENDVELLATQLISPLNAIAPTIYRFYIQDTSIIKGTPMVHMYFAPRQKTDLAFMGHLWIALDSTYSVRKIEAGIPKDINLNWVNELQVTQEYDWVETPPQYEGDTTSLKKGLMLVKDELFIDFGITKGDSTRTMLGKRVTSYKDYSVNKKLPDSLFGTKVVQFRDNDADVKDEVYWATHRHDSLSRREQGIYSTVDSLKRFKPFKRFLAGARFVFEGYTSVKGFDIGPANTFYSFNPIEGFRMRVGGRTNLKFSKHLMFEGYGAYGFRDEKFKGFAGLRYNFSDGKLMRYPYNQLRLWFQEDMRIPGQELQFVQEDNIFLSFKRGVNDKMFLTRTIGSEYWKEFTNGFSFNVSAKNIRQAPAGNIVFSYYDKGERKFKENIQTTELGMMLRYAPNEKFFEGNTYRTPILTKYPIVEMRYTKGIKGLLNSEYNYHRLQFKGEKVFYLAPFGYSDLIVEAGRTFGKIPYPLLNIHRANQAFSYQTESYNLMNFLEFASDQYASINYFHNFGGVFFGRIPLFKKLKWREVVTFKSLWGRISDENLPTQENGLVMFPTETATDATSTVLMHSLEKKPYIETSVGIANIFKLFRVDYVWRVNYRELPNAPKGGLRMRVKVEF